MVVLLSTGCVARDPQVVSSPDPSSKVPAIKRAVREHDLSVAPQLVKDLDNDDPAVRFYAIDGLRKLSGQDFGYRYYDDEEHRNPAIQRWRNWLGQDPVLSRH